MNPVAIQLARRLLNESFHDSFEDAIGHFLAAQQRAISHDQFLKPSINTRSIIHDFSI